MVESGECGKVKCHIFLPHADMLLLFYLFVGRDLEN